MMNDDARSQAGEHKGPESREEKANDQGAGELSIEELAKVAGGTVISLATPVTSTLIAVTSKNTTFTSSSK
jgi:hypothetical protein